MISDHICWYERTIENHRYVVCVWHVFCMFFACVAVAGLPTDVLKETLIGPGCQGLPPGSCLDACAAAWPRRGKSLHGMAKSVEDPEIRSKAKTLELAWRRHGWQRVGCGCWPRMVFSQKTRA